MTKRLKFPKPPATSFAVAPPTTIRKLGRPPRNAPAWCPAPTPNKSTLKDFAALRRRLRFRALPVAPPPRVAPSTQSRPDPAPSERVEFDRTVLNIHLHVSTPVGGVLPPGLASGLIERHLRELEERLSTSPFMRYPFRPRRTH